MKARSFFTGESFLSLFSWQSQPEGKEKGAKNRSQWGFVCVCVKCHLILLIQQVQKNFRWTQCPPVCSGRPFKLLTERFYSVFDKTWYWEVQPDSNWKYNFQLFVFFCGYYVSTGEKFLFRILFWWRRCKTYHLSTEKFYCSYISVTVCLFQF